MKDQPCHHPDLSLEQDDALFESEQTIELKETQFSVSAHFRTQNCCHWLSVRLSQCIHPHHHS